ncbi:unnamed protein product, partial [Litomosoides sigmodontis]
AFPDNDYVIYGLRYDGNILLLPSSIARDESVVAKLPDLLDMQIYADLVEVPGFVPSRFSAALIEVRGLLQFIATWGENIPDNSNKYSYTRVTYVEAFRLLFTPTPDEIIHPATFTTLFYFSDTDQHFFSFKTTADSRLIFHQIGYYRNGTYEVTLGRTGTKLFVHKITKFKDPWIDPVRNLMVVTRETTKWLARKQKSPTPIIECFATTESRYDAGILYSRRNLIKLYYEAGNSAFDCSKSECRKELRNDGGKKYHDKEVDAIHQKGSIYLGYRNGYLFSYCVNDEKEKFSEILFSLDLMHRPAKDEVSKDDDLYVFSTDGKEAIAVICGKTTYYRIYNINPLDGVKFIDVKKSEMTVVKELNKKCRKADYDAKGAKLIFFIDASTAHELRLTINHDGILKSYADPKLNRFDSYRGVAVPFEGIESQWPLHLRNGRSLVYNENTNAIEMKYDIIESKDKTVSNTKILTNYGKYVKTLLYFPTEYIEDEYMKRLRKRSEKFPLSFYGIINCTVFVILKYEDFDKLKLTGSKCSKAYKMRAILLDSHITVLRTKNGIDVDAVRIKVSIDHNDVKNGITNDERSAY